MQYSSFMQQTDTHNIHDKRTSKKSYDWTSYIYKNSQKQNDKQISLLLQRLFTYDETERPLGGLRFG